ncbi:MAG: hypothetical protein K1X71_10365 [Pirellulales bacterium]|nr:hypothetical protein [Pirellulales bacterium]
MELLAGIVLDLLVVPFLEIAFEVVVRTVYRAIMSVVSVMLAGFKRIARSVRAVCKGVP